MNKKLIIIIVIALVFVGFVVIGNIAYNLTDGANEIKTTNEVKENKETNNVQINEKDDKKIAVVYFSATGTTKKVAEMIKDDTNADIFEIIPKQKYTSEDLNYSNSETRATKEQNDSSARPGISSEISLDGYDTIYIGYPIWW
jgi:Sec-independent protein translocase protein TatA